MDDFSGGHKNKVKKQFGASSDSYASSEVHAKGESLSLLLNHMGPKKSWRVLDVATGAGHTALAFAPYVDHVIATDITHEMLVQAEKLAKERGIKNIETYIADAEHLPFDDDSFDLVTCRIALHHVADVKRAIKEFARVLRPGGMLGITDNITVEDELAAAYHNGLEKVRDPSHYRVYPLSALTTHISSGGFDIISTHKLSKEIELNEWADRQRVSAQDKAKLEVMIRQAPEALKPLFKPRRDYSKLYFNLWEAVIIARKKA